MGRETLIEFFDDHTRSSHDFLVYDDGYREWSYRYDEVGALARRVASALEAFGIGKGDTVLFWGENRPEWLVAFWGCLLRGAVVVPIDYRASAEFLTRVRGIVGAKLALVGTEVDPSGLPADLVRWNLADLPDWPARDTGPTPVAVGRDDVIEIIFTSGATAEPKGVVIRHGNVLANIVPIEREIAKYKRYAIPFRPIRFLNLLPLSHMFGQSMAGFIPPMLDGITVFMHGFNPHEILRQIRGRRVSVLVCVPKILDVLREHVLRLVPDSADPPPPGERWWRRWWRYRRVHRLFGWKFWSFVVGAAPLDPALEEFWSRLGFVVVQGYGLTETAPIVTLNHPFSARRGTVGKPIAGVEVKLAPDGEILVRGENVTSGYFGVDPRDMDAFEDGWLRTGDVGTIDDEGRLTIRGRKKEMIVTPEGLNVFPEDIERVLEAQPGVVESAVVGRNAGGEERVHAVLVLQPGADADAIVRAANAQLEDHQRIRSVSVWPGAALPRTEGTRKLRRREIRDWVAGGGRRDAAPQTGRDVPLEAIVARFVAEERRIGPDTTIEELGLSSLERVELMMALEERFQTTLDESAFAAARTVADLQALVGGGEAAPGRAAQAVATVPASTQTVRPAAGRAQEPVDFPAWNRTAIARALRRVSLPTWILPLGRYFARVSVEGLEHLQGLEGPVVFAANHQSHFDAPVILMALPARWRYRVAIAMAKEFFAAHFFAERHGRRAWFTNSLNYYLAALFFNAFPLPQREAGTRQTLRYMGDLIADGWSILIFPEGRRTQQGEINPFRPGIGMIGARLRVPVVPVRIVGADRVLHQSWRWPAKGPVTVKFGQPLRLVGEDYAALAHEVEEAVRRL